MKSEFGLVVLMSALALVACTAAPAQTNSVYRSVEAQPGRPLRLGVYAALKQDCSVGPLPGIRVTMPPKKGALSVRSGTLKTNRMRRCPQLEAPVQIVLYQANPGSTGDDEVNYEVTNPDGAPQSHSVKIVITARPGGTQRSDPTTEL
jgi:hypothetical protein